MVCAEYEPSTVIDELKDEPLPPTPPPTHTQAHTHREGKIPSMNLNALLNWSTWLKTFTILYVLEGGEIGGSG